MKEYQNESSLKIKAVHDDNLHSFLEQLGLLSAITNNKLKCSFCDCLITLDNFGGVYRKNDKIEVFCSKTECYLDLLKRKKSVE